MGDFRYQKCLGKQNVKVFSKFRHNLCLRQDKFSCFQMKTFIGTLTYIVLKSSIWKDQSTIWTVKFENGMLLGKWVGNSSVNLVRIAHNVHKWVAWISLNNLNGLATASTPKILAQKIGWQQQIIRKLNPPGMYIQKLGTKTPIWNTMG